MYPTYAKPDRSTYVFHSPPSVTIDLYNAGNLQTNSSRTLRSVYQPFLQPCTNRTRKIPVNNKNIANNKRSIVWKIIWFITVVICSIVCFYQIVDRVKHFFNEPVSSNVELITNTSMQFPAFTLCPPIPYRFAKLYNLYLGKKLDPKKDEFLKVMSLLNVSDFYDLASYTLPDAKTKSATHAEIHMFLSMSNIPSQGGVVMPTIRNLSTYAGKCATASFEKPTLYQGVSTMFKIFFASEMSVTKMIIRRDHLDVDKISTVYLHESNDDPVHIAPVSSFKLLREYTTTISLDVKEYRFLNRKKILCISQSEANRCKGDCVAKQVLPRLKCRVPMDFQQLAHLPLCNDSKSFMEFISIIGKTYANVSSMNACTSKCPRRCSQTLYAMNVQYLSKPPNADVNNMSTAEFYFSDNVFERIEECFTYGIINLLCDMGGNLGLFLGFSFLTLLDIIHSLSNGASWLKQTYL